MQQKIGYTLFHGSVPSIKVITAFTVTAQSFLEFLEDSIVIWSNELVRIKLLCEFLETYLLLNDRNNCNLSKNTWI